jgi:hypothetical protein
MIQFLERQNTDHYRMFCDTLDFYLGSNDHQHSGYTLEGQRKFVDIHRQMFLEAPGDAYHVLADIEGDFITGLGIGFTHSVLLSRPQMHLVPAWHLAFTWRGQKAWASPKQFLFDITNPISLMMESRGVFEFTKVMRAGPMFKTSGTHKYVERIYNRNVPDGRYNAYVDAYVTAETDLSVLPNVQRKILPDEVTSPLIIVKHVLKNELRVF